MKKQQIERRERVHGASRSSSRRALTGSGAALLSAVALACGAKTDNVGESTKWPGVGGAHSGGSAGGRAAGGSVDEMILGGARSGDGGSSSASAGMTASGGTSDGEGGELSGGSGGAGSGGKEGSESGGGSGQSGGAASGGAEGVEEGYGVLGAACGPPGSLACSKTSPALALICDTDETWQQGAICEDDKRCYPKPGEKAGTCQTVDPECEGRAGETHCEEGGDARLCDDEGIFSQPTTCGAGCDEGVCVPEPPECPEPEEDERVSDCAGLCKGEVAGGCSSQDTLCKSSSAFIPFPNDWSGKVYLIRIAAGVDLCRNSACGRSAFPMWTPLGADNFAVEVPEGWGLIVANPPLATEADDIPCEGEPQTGCVTFRGAYQTAFFVPLEPGLGETFVRVTPYASNSTETVECR